MIRKAARGDLPEIMRVYAYARKFMIDSGNASQWGANYPPEALIAQDIACGQSYVITGENGEICGVFAFIIGEDPTYAVIEDGAWLSDAPYGVIHRIAGNGTVHGLMQQAVDFCRGQIPHLRIDTHADNHVMQHLIAKCGFTRCGIIHVRDGSPRIAYEML